MKLKKYLFAFIFLFALFILWNSSSYAGDLNLKNLNYDVTLNSDGTANITETWDIEIEYTNTLFKTFEIDKSKYSEIKDVSLVETTNGMERSFSQIYEEKYHVDKNCFYALVNSYDQFEIAWGVHEDNSYARRTFKMSYTVVDAIKNYSDCSEFYWQFLNTSSAIPADKVTGTITLPTNVELTDDFRVWAHGPLNGNITKISNNTATFEVENFDAYTMLEARIVTPTYVFEGNQNRANSSNLSTILNQEQEWADEANSIREKIVIRKKATRITFISFFIASNIGGIALIFVLTNKIKKYRKELEEAPDIKPTNPSKYYRDIPNENQSPAQAAFLYYFKDSNFSTHIPNAISATILDLCLKKYLSFELVENKKNEVKIILVSNISKEALPKDEKTVYEMLEKVSTAKEFTIKEFEKYCKKHSSSILAKYNNIEPNAKFELVSQKSYDTNLLNKRQKFLDKGTSFIFLTILSFIFMIASVIPSIVCAVYCFKIAHKYNTLTQKGSDEKEAWKGLKNFMEDFSMLDKKEVPELVLWEKYLVYATAFGISDKVLKQLKVVYPQITDEQFMSSYGYSYLYFMSNRNFSNTFIRSINNSVTSAYNSANYSSGSGGGGGFSGGGGFGGGGGRNGRKIVPASLTIHLHYYKIIFNKEEIYYGTIFNYFSYYYSCCFMGN